MDVLNYQEQSTHQWQEILAVVTDGPRLHDDEQGQTDHAQQHDFFEELLDKPLHLLHAVDPVLKLVNQRLQEESIENYDTQHIRGVLWIVDGIFGRAEDGPGKCAVARRCSSSEEPDCSIAGAPADGEGDRAQHLRARGSEDSDGSQADTERMSNSIRSTQDGGAQTRGQEKVLIGEGDGERAAGKANGAKDLAAP